VGEINLAEAKPDAAKRLGKTAACLVLSKFQPHALENFPAWVPVCLSHIAEATAQGASEGIEEMDSAFALGTSLGNFSMLAGFIRNPEERWAPGSMKGWIEEYFNAYTSTLAEKAGVQLPANMWADYAQMLFSAYLGFNIDQRRGFVRGMVASIESEENIRNDELRTTSATPLYLELVLFWSEVNAMNSLNEVFRFLKARFAKTPAVLGDFERFRKCANRIGLSFKDQLA